jgi:hypothetical protein
MRIKAVTHRARCVPDKSANQRFGLKFAGIQNLVDETSQPGMEAISNQKPHDFGVERVKLK